MKTKVFIGASVEALDVAEAIQCNLQYVAEVTIWSQGVFTLSKFPFDALEAFLKEADFGIFVFTPDDIVKIRTATYRSVRDNLLFELGLFAGRLGRERCFIVTPRDAIDFHLPTDLLGIIPGTYDASRTSNLLAAVGPVCMEIKQILISTGKFSIEERWMPSEVDSKKLMPYTFTQNLTGFWLSRFLYTAKRNGGYQKGIQFNIEYLIKSGGRNLIGTNILCRTQSEKAYFHELRVQTIGNYLVGTWYNTNTQNLGVFELYIHTHNHLMTGMHIGNANDNTIQCGSWGWIKVETDGQDLNHAADKIKKMKLLPFETLENQFDNWINKAAVLSLSDIMA